MNIFCYRCGGAVQGITQWECQRTGDFVIEVTCHGQREQMRISAEARRDRELATALEDAAKVQVGLAFRSAKPPMFYRPGGPGYMPA